MDSFEDFIKAETEAREAADAQVTPDIARLKIGDYCVRRTHGVNIYSEILDPCGYLLAGGRTYEDLDEDEKAEYDDVRELYAQPHMKHYRFTRSYSQYCTRGELGDIHLMGVEKINKETFEKIKKAAYRGDF